MFAINVIVQPPQSLPKPLPSTPHNSFSEDRSIFVPTPRGYGNIRFEQIRTTLHPIFVYAQPLWKHNIYSPFVISKSPATPLFIGAFIMIMNVGTCEVTSVKIVMQEAVTFQCKGGHGFGGDVEIMLIIQRAHMQHPIYPENSESP